ncbi:hypothetical protein Sango_1626100 [Sesamum angolense]|uniref:Bacterial Ig-like domain-containing protein n=1 Tax=Sesamum angolense TaxID=2727404 RepID=A0AAE1WJP4_9LAMI|nr:hypothetical protein Sango_1626100 [Sesamum angolense]
MGLKVFSFLFLQCWVLLVLSLGVQSDGSEVALELLRTPHAFSNRNFANFGFQVLVGGNGSLCTDCSTNCKLDHGMFSICEGGKISYTRLTDGNHSFEVCTNGPRGAACASYNWTIDTVKPTAYITAATSFTSASYVSVNISFSEPCGGGGGFRCPSVNACNLLVYGAGQVMPNTLTTVKPNLEYSLIVSVSERVRYGRLILLTNISELAIVTVSLQSNLVISRQGTPVAPVSPVTFLYDSQRPTVRLSTTCNMRTKEKSIVILIKFMKPVFGFNSFHEMSRQNYAVRIQADNDVISVSVPENITTDVSGNRNRASNTLQVMHYSVPVESLVISYFATAAFAATALVAGFLTVSTTSLLSAGAFSRPSSILCSDPARNLFRIASHIQIFALSRWLSVTLPVEYYELARGLQWSIPYFKLPWEKGNIRSIMVGSTSPKDRLFRISEAHDSLFLEGLQPDTGNSDSAAKVFGLPLTPMEYRSYFESQTIMPEAEYILDPQNSHGKQNKEKQSYGALIFPRFEIFLLILALPCFCEASAALIQGGTSSGMIVGVLILSLVAFLLLCLLLFLSFGITFGKLLQYKEVHQEGQKFHWYQELIRVTLGPGKRGQWTWKNQHRSFYLTILGPLFEDLRGPPKYMLSQISGGSFSKPGGSIIASDDETEDAEAPFIQKLFGILRIYYTLIESVKRIALGIVAGAYSGTWSSRTPTITLLCITSFQLFFMVLKKPFIKKKVQLVEIISVSCQVAIFAFCLVLLEREFPVGDERKIGISMVSIFLLAFLVQMMNEWFPINNSGETDTTSADRNRSSGSRSSGEKPWLRHIRELARSSFSKEGNKNSPSDPSTSKTRWSGFWKSKRSGSSSASNSTDFKSKPRLYKELEDIFASK